MSKYYILESREHTLVGMISYRNSGWGTHFTRGELLEENFGEGEILVEFEKNHDQLPDYFELSAVPVVSENFVRHLEALAPENFQLFPVTVKMPGRELSGYSIINVVGRVPAVDGDASDCKMYDGDIMRLNKLVLKKDLDRGLDLFRAEEYPLAIFISGAVKDALEAGSLTGMRITPADGWSDKHRF